MDNVWRKPQSQKNNCVSFPMVEEGTFSVLFENPKINTIDGGWQNSAAFLLLLFSTESEFPGRRM